MDKEKAVTIIEEIFEECRQVDGKTVKLMPPKANNSLSNTYQICVQTRDEIVQACLLDIAQRHGLTVKLKDGSITVSNPIHL